jgi:hypothetical protein
MRRLSLLIILTLILSSCNPFATNDLDKWVKLSNKYYSIQVLEGYKNYSDDKERTALGTIPQYSFYWRNPNWSINELGIKLMEFSYFEIPKTFESKSNQWILDTCTRFFIQQQYPILSDGRVIENEEIALNAFSGRSIVASEDVGKGDSLIVFQKLYVVHSRVYILRANGYKSVLNRPAIDRFMQSFQITD